MNNLRRFAAACIALIVSAACASAQGDTVPLKGPCFRGRPEPACRQFLITEVNVYGGVFSGSGNRGGVSAELGLMDNQGAKSARGITAMVSAGYGARLALKGRYRRWQPGGGSIDFAGGVLAGLREPSTGDGRGVGLTGDVAFNAHDIIALNVRADLLTTHAGTERSLFVGVRTGSKAAVVTTGLLLAVGGLLLWGLSNID